MGESRVATTDLSASPTTQKLEFKHVSGAFAKLAIALVVSGEIAEPQVSPPVLDLNRFNSTFGQAAESPPVLHQRSNRGAVWMFYVVGMWIPPCSFIFYV